MAVSGEVIQPRPYWQIRTLEENSRQPSHRLVYRRLRCNLRTDRCASGESPRNGESPEATQGFVRLPSGISPTTKVTFRFWVVPAERLRFRFGKQEASMKRSAVLFAALTAALWLGPAVHAQSNDVVP